MLRREFLMLLPAGSFLLNSRDTRSASVRFGRVVEQHVREIFGQGYALAMDVKDFDHGHMLIAKDGAQSYELLDDFVSSVRILLYHTDESPISDNNVHIHRKKPRSIVGMMDGRIAPAADLVDTKKLRSPENFRDHGTIYPDDIVLQYPDLKYSHVKAEWPKIRSLGSLNYVFDLVPDPSGCFEAAGIKFDILFEYDSGKGSGTLYKKLTG